jgi:hypothetical protein
MGDIRALVVSDTGHMGGAMAEPAHPGSVTHAFGVDDHPRCPRCDRLMYVIRRTLQFRRDVRYERQTLACVCGESCERSVDEAGRAVQF